VIKATCHCGACTIVVPSMPATLNDCNCSICRRYGVLWAYYSPKDVRIDSGGKEPDKYLWGDKQLYFARCKDCGCVTHWHPVDDYDRMGVNARLMPVELFQNIHIRRSNNSGTGLHIGGWSRGMLPPA
jgi:hypothetical protein